MEKWNVDINFYDGGSRVIQLNQKPNQDELARLLESFLQDYDEEWSVLPDDVDFEKDDFVLPFSLHDDFLKDGEIWVSKGV